MGIGSKPALAADVILKVAMKRFGDLNGLQTERTLAEAAPRIVLGEGASARTRELVWERIEPGHFRAAAPLEPAGAGSGGPDSHPPPAPGCRRRVRGGAPTAASRGAAAARPAARRPARGTAS